MPCRRRCSIRATLWAPLENSSAYGGRQGRGGGSAQLEAHYAELLKRHSLEAFKGCVAEEWGALENSIHGAPFLSKLEQHCAADPDMYGGVSPGLLVGSRCVRGVWGATLPTRSCGTEPHTTPGVYFD